MYAIVTDNYRQEFEIHYHKYLDNGEIPLSTLSLHNMKPVTNPAAAYRHLIRDYVIPIWQGGIENDHPSAWFSIASSLSGIMLGLDIAKKTKHHEDLADLQGIALVRAFSLIDPTFDDFQAGKSVSIN